MKLKPIMIALFGLLNQTQSYAKTEKQATFAGGCFWCMEPPFEKANGVISVTSGFTNGSVKDPTYQQVSDGKTGHVEAVLVTYDEEKISYIDLLNIFWRNIDPTDGDGQFVDRGEQYASAIFFHDERQQKDAEQSKNELATSKRFDKTIVTKILPATIFYPAEEYHQDYYKKNPLRYKYYRFRSGRDEFINKAWHKDSLTTSKKEELRMKLDELQYKVTQEDATEPPFKNKYWDNKKPGIYVDIVSGEALFSSLDKYDSGSGWPAFTKPLVSSNIVEKEDRSLFTTRTEVRSKGANSHLGHVFNDGPKPLGTRYCINSAALRFIPVEDLEKEGYKEYLSLFK